MIRFAWLQARTQTAVTAAAVAVLAVVAAVTGIHLAHLYDSSVAHCQSGCDLALDQFLSHDSFLQHAFDLLVQVTPALFGIFWGAPLIGRELESGTYRLVWTQSITRSRWVVTKLATGGLATIALAGLLSLTVTWWYRSIDPVSTNQYSVFDRRDIAPIAYAAFAFAAGAFLGAVIRRSVPAMATTLGVYVFARIATAVWLRPHLLTPVHTTATLANGVGLGFVSRNGSPVTLAVKGSGPPESWTLSSHLATSSGHVPSSGELSAFLQQHCPTILFPPSPPTGNGKIIARAGDDSAFRACAQQAAQVYHLAVTYLPSGRYWTLQWVETGIFAALALLAAAACYVWTTRRVS